ncbi:MAG: peptide chain release factor 2 [Candidatus Eremiobacteraeota bacterium]|nr:peptide chain release factor 2 [Candidatus Eremiobacteraeota bacterium]
MAAGLRDRVIRPPGEPRPAVSDAQIAAIDRARERLNALKVRLDDAGKRRSAAELEARSRADDFWGDPEKARGVMKRIADLRSDLDAVDAVEAALGDAAEIIEVLGDEPGAEAEADAMIARAVAALDELEMAANFDRPYDSHGAIVTIRAGAGGTDAADWTQMLGRMYLRWAENHGFENQVVEEAPGDEAGLRSITFIIRGKNAYGMLESERGVHRLVRISPFDNQGRRQTSFAEVDVVPEMEEGDAGDVEIKPEDLKVETFKASGAGGQYVNKTESAIRIYHLPTGLVVASQQERSQMQNRDVALNILRAKLVQRAREEQEAKLNALRGERMANEWGSQIRNYVLHPYQMVKDVRTNVETGNAAAVLEGDLDGFIWPYLQNRNKFAPVAGDAA